MTKNSIIIRCYNEEEHIGRLLSGIMQQTIKDTEIILVDSGSTDATLSIASRYPVKLVYIPPEDFSFGRALNLGCREAEGDFLVFISAHCWPVYNDWLEELIRPFEDPNVALVYGKQRGYEKSHFSEHQIFKRWFPDTSDYNQKHPFCNNANCAVRRSIWEKQPYDEELTGLEDLDWAKKAVDKGYKIAYSAAAEIIHVHEETPQKIYNRYRREAIALKKIFPDEKFSFINFISLSIGNIFGDFVAAKKKRVLSGNIRNIISFRLMQFWGTYKGNSEKIKVHSDLKKTFYYPNNLKSTEINGSHEKRNGYIDYSSITRFENNEKDH